MHRSRASTLFLLVGALAIAGCGGGGKSIDDVRSCLEDASFKVAEPSGPEANQIEQGVSGTAGTGADLSSLTIAVAAEVKKESYVDKVAEGNSSFINQLDAETRKKFKLESGDEGKYVWIVAGNASSETFKSGQECVKP